MPRKNNDTVQFGARLAKLRKHVGFTQLELANEIGVSRRMIAYYENETRHPPSTLLTSLAEALGVSTDELLGVESMREQQKEPSSRLMRRLQQTGNLRLVKNASFFKSSTHSSRIIASRSK